MRSLERVVTHDEADWEFLKLANEKGKFAIELGLVFERDGQNAFERGIDKNWFRLVDLAPIAHAPSKSKFMRVFKLTSAGQLRRDCLKPIFDPENKGEEDAC